MNGFLAISVLTIAYLLTRRKYARAKHLHDLKVIGKRLKESEHKFKQKVMAKITNDELVSAERFCK